MNKEEIIYKKSNPYKVYKNAIKLLGPEVILELSTQKNKKYMILNPDTNKWIHFGNINYEDYTKHKDKQRRERFLIRNDKWKYNDIYTPSYLSFYLLW